MNKNNIRLQQSIRRKLICFNDYYASEGARELAHRAKEGDIKACQQIAREIAKRVKFPKGVTLIPVPSSSGVATNNLIVCQELSKLLGLSVSDCLKGHSRDKLYDLKKQGVEVTPDFFGFTAQNAPTSGSCFVFDVVVDKATTMLAAKQALPGKQVFCVAHSMVGLDLDRQRSRAIEAEWQTLGR